MTSAEPDDLRHENPFAAPTAELPTAEPAEQQYQKLLKQFRSQRLALGVAWIAMAMLIAGISYYSRLVANAMTGAPAVTVLTLVLVATFAGWTVFGLFTCLGKSWAVWGGLIISYLLLLMSLATLNLCTIILLLIVILQAHRVISMEKKLKTGAAGRAA